MKALMLTQHFLPQLGGIQNYLLTVVSCFAPEDILIIAPIEKKDMEDGVLATYTVLRRPFRKFIGFLPSLFGLSRMLHKFAPDLIICGHVKQGIEGFILGKLLNRPYIVIVYAKEIHQFSRNPIFKWVIVQVISHAARAIVISEYTKQLTESFLGSNAQYVSLDILNPIHKEPLTISAHYVNSVKEKFAIPEGRLIFSVSRLEERKGIDKVIESMPAVWAKFPDTIFVVASVGPHEEVLKTKAQEVVKKYTITGGITPTILFIGKISDQEKAALFMLCDLYITPSRVISGDDAEGFGIVFLEANSYGKPVVAGNSGGIPDAVVDNKTGILVNPEDSSHIADAIRKLLADPELANTLGAQGQQRAIEHFSKKRFCTMLHSILDEATQ